MIVPVEVGRLKSPLSRADIDAMALHDLPEFDPGIIERYVENTYRKANAVFLGSVVAGVMIGAVFGATPLTSLGASWPIPRAFGFATMLVGAIVGGVIGYLIGDTRAFLARLQGQTALAQIEAAKDARLALDAIRQIQALATRRTAGAPARPQPEAAPASPAPAAPVAPAPPLLQAAPAPAPVAAEPAPVEAAPAPPTVELASVPVSAPAEIPAAAPVEASPPPAPLHVAPEPAPPTLVVAGATGETVPPVTPPLSS
jgi:hypothetical protein